MSDKLDNLGWPEAKLFDLAFEGDTLNFSMLDLLSYSNPLKFEVVEVSISEIEALKIELTPYRGGDFLDKEVVVDIGATNENDECFEGGIEENSLTNTKADHFWVSADVNAKNIKITRTGIYEYVPRVR